MTLLRATVYIYPPEAPERMLHHVIELLATDEEDFRQQVRRRYYPDPTTLQIECAVIGEPWRIQGLPR